MEVAGGSESDGKVSRNVSLEEVVVMRGRSCDHIAGRRDSGNGAQDQGGVC